MKKIKLTQNKFAIVDDEDFEKLNQHKWYATKSWKCEIYYAKRSIGKSPNQRQLCMHRVILGEFSSKNHIDHINGDGLDNRKENLRVVSQRENSRNMTKKSKSSSKFKGITWNKECCKWRVRICVDRKRLYLGDFKDEVEAAKVYNKAALKYFGEFAKLNEIEE